MQGPEGMEEGMTFLEAAASNGVPVRMFYPVKVVARVLGVPVSTLNDEINAGRMKYMLPEGRKQGRVIRPEWVDEWIKEGTHA